MGKATYTYIFFRVLFGLYLIYHGFTEYKNISQNQGYFYQTVDSFERKVIQQYELQIDLKSLKGNSAEILAVANLLIMFGGYLVMFGFKISKYFVAMGMITDFIFIHNFLFLANGKMLNFTVKSLSILGGALVIH